MLTYRDGRLMLGVCALALLAGFSDRAKAQAAAPVTPTDAPILSITRDLRIDGNAESLVEVRWLLVARDGSIAVSQDRDTTIRFFSPTGAALGRFGRRGAGPGEFTSLSRAGWVGDTLWVYDAGQRRATFMAPGRTALRTIRAPAIRAAPRDASRFPPVLSPIFPRAIMPDGSWIIIAAAAPRSMALTSSSQVVDGMFLTPIMSMQVLNAVVPPGYDIASPEIIRVGADSEIVQRIGRLPPDPSFLPIASPAFPGAVTLPFVAPPLESVAPDGGWIAIAHEVSQTATGGTFRVVAIRAAGDTMWARSYPFTGVPIPQRVLDSTTASFNKASNSNLPQSVQEQDAVVMAALRAHGPLPRNYPPLAQLLSGRDGTLWIGMRPSATTRPYLVLDQRGQPYGRLSVPLNTRILAAEAGMIWGVETDTDEIPSIVRYRVSRP